MNRIVPLVVLMALAGCSAQPDNAPQDGSSTSEPAPPAGTADKRQVERAAQPGGIALQHNIGLGGAVVVSAYRRA